MAAPQRSLVLQTTKSNIRRMVTTMLSGVPKREIAKQSDIVTQSVLHQAWYHQARRISIFLSMPDKELNTTRIVQKALQDGKKVFVPYLRKTSEADRGPDGYLPARCMDMLRLKNFKDFQSLKRDKWGIPTLPDVAPNAQAEGKGERESVLRGPKGDGVLKGLDLMLLPGVAFQVGREGEVRRLGHGKGFYDFFLRRLRKGIEDTDPMAINFPTRTPEGWPKLVGLALEEQVLETEEDDHEKLPMGENDQILDSLVVGDGRILGVKDLSWGQQFPEYSQEEVVEGMKKREP